MPNHWFTTPAAQWNHLESFRNYSCLHSNPRDSDLICLRCGLNGLTLKVFQVILMCRQQGELLSWREAAAELEVVLRTEGTKRGLTYP